LPNAIGIGTDISAAAIEIARDNAVRHRMAARVTFVCCDGAGALSGALDFIVSNPPYVARGEIPALPPEVRDYDPAVALDGGNDGLNVYRAIVGDARRLLAPGGRLIVELGAGQERAVAALFTKAGLQVSQVRKDLAGIPRALSASVP
jgi:release factor glutamine methyltransferase